MFRVKGPEQPYIARQQHSIAEHVAFHAADAHDGEWLDIDVDAQFPKMPPDADAGAARRDPETLVMKSVRAARREAVAEPKAVLSRDLVRPIRKARGALVGSDDKIRIRVVIVNEFRRARRVGSVPLSVRSSKPRMKVA